VGGTQRLREVGLWAGPDTVEEVFGGIAELARRCRFRDCSHAGEPGCAVSESLRIGELDEARWASYRKLLAEARHHERSMDPLAAANAKRRWKSIHAAMRHHPKYTR
jgi:ribosome biogenesis GTPase